MGYVGWLGTFEGRSPHPNYPITTESVMVDELRRLGAVVYVKTSVPHTLMCGETVNNIIGYTLSPTNRLLSCGGSSGGEGALIALKGSPCGFGTDSVLSVVGPLAGSVASLRLLVKALLGVKPWNDDPMVIELPWREEKEGAVTNKKKLVFGVMRDDGVVGVTPPVKRAINVAVEKLKAAGHEVSAQSHFRRA